MKISRIETIPFAIPYRKPLRFASGEITIAEHVLVRVHTDEGLVGTAEAPPRPFTYGETQASIIGVIDGLFAPRIIGLSPLEREVIRSRLNLTVANPAAKAAIDMAVWDVIGQSLGVPVTELLGGYGNRMRVAHIANTPPERVSELAREVLEAVHATIRKYQVTYAEYDALKAWLIQIGEDGEWPLFLDVFVEHVIEEVANAAREGSKGTIEGPFYAPGAPLSHREVTLPMRDGEAGTPLQFRGQVRSVAGTPLANATVDIWHCDDEGFYSQFAPGLPEWNLRGQVTTDENGNFVINTIEPAPYQIPTDGATGAIIRAANWHAWRPAHLHLKVSAPDHLLITTQLYFPGDPHNDDDIATAVKPELMLDPKPAADGTGVDVVYDFVLDPA